ncbi:MAG: cell division ATPase MinD [Candidatus Aenigmarchaeota archaeon]|nr:cell division ATPase MinD [Candidatus Aenigmarchaeota archaeon]
MTRLICCTSAKGGVGKTTIVSNLAAALTDFGENTIAIDANLSTPNLGLHTGMHLAPRTLHDVLRGYYPLKFAIYSHPYGFKIIPASLKLSDIADVDVGRLPEVTFSLLGRANYILLDSAAGLGREALSALSAADEVLLITNPTLPAVTDALKILKIAQNTHIKTIGVVVNRVKNTDYELSKEEIEEILGIPVVSQIPEDPNVERCIQQKKLLFELYPNTPAAIEIKKLAAFLAQRKYEPPKTKENIFSRFFKIFKS